MKDVHRRVLSLYVIAQHTEGFVREAIAEIKSSNYTII